MVNPKTINSINPVIPMESKSKDDSSVVIEKTDASASAQPSTATSVAIYCRKREKKESLMDVIDRRVLLFFCLMNVFHLALEY